MPRATDFADRGASEAWWTYCRTVAFLNAALQGMNQLRKVFFTRSGLGGKTRGPFDVVRHSRHARRSYARALLLVAIPAGALWWNSSGDERLERYESQAAFEKASHVYLYDVGGTDYRIPVPFELGAVFMKFPELILDRVLGLKTVDTDCAVDPLPLPTVRSLAESTFLLSFIPALVQPTWYVLRNEDFLGREIEPRYLRDWRSGDRFFASTPTLARAIGTAVPGVSPLQAKVLLEGHLGHMARLAIHGTEEALWDTEKNGEMAFPQFWYRASGRRAIVREGPRRYTRHTLDLKLLDARAGAPKWRCDQDWRTCEANADWLAVADYVSDYTSFAREIRGERAARISAIDELPGLRRGRADSPLAMARDALSGTWTRRGVQPRKTGDNHCAGTPRAAAGDSGVDEGEKVHGHRRGTDARDCGSQGHRADDAA